MNAFIRLCDAKAWAFDNPDACECNEVVGPSIMLRKAGEPETKAEGKLYI